MAEDLRRAVESRLDRGANTTPDRVRQSLLVGYCLGWLRGETNQQLMWPPEVARDFPRKLRRLIGYAVEGNVIGCIQLGQDRIVLLEDAWGRARLG